MAHSNGREEPTGVLGALLEDFYQEAWHGFSEVEQREECVRSECVVVLMK